jgi:hypothetical protein
MTHQNPQRIITAVCPNCGPSQISVVLEGSSDLNRLSRPNRSCGYWAGRCCKCHACLETNLGSDQLATTLEWTTVDEDKLRFLFGDSPPTQGDAEAHPLWDSDSPPTQGDSEVHPLWDFELDG